MYLIKVHFGAEYKKYSYNSTQKAESGDLAVALTPSSGFTLCTVVDCQDGALPGNKWLIGVISLREHQEREDRRKRAKEIEDQLARAAAAKAELDKYAHLRGDPALAALIEELEKLK